MAYFGLTGGVASGKSTAARLFEELGAKIVDADRIGHELLSKSSPAYAEILRRFGRDILDSSGEINRQRLAALVFADAGRLRELNAILHPRIIDRVEELANNYSAQDPRAVVLVDAALIIEAGIGGRFAKLIVTWCRPEQQIKRMVKKGLSRQEAERRIAAQMPAEEKRRRADFLMDCSGSLDETRRQVGELYPQLRRLVQGGAA